MNINLYVNMKELKCIIFWGFDVCVKYIKYVLYFIYV